MEATSTRFEDVDRDVTFRSTQATSTFKQKWKNHRTSDNVTAQFTDNLRARFAFNYNEQIRENLLPSIDGSGSPTANYNIGQNSPTPAIRATSTTSSTTRGSSASVAATTAATSWTKGSSRTRFLFNNTTNIGMRCCKDLGAPWASRTCRPTPRRSKTTRRV